MKFSKILFSLLLATIMAAPIVATSADYTRTSTIQSVNTFTPTTGSTVTLTRANQVNAALTPATDLASLTIALPTSPKDGDSVTITTSKNINAVTFTNGTTSGAPASMSAGGGVSFVYTAANTTWSLANGSSTPLASLSQGAAVANGDLFLTRQSGDSQDKKVQSELIQRYVLRGYLVDPRDPKYGNNTCTGYYNIAASAVNNGGSGYAVNDTFKIINPSLKGNGTPAIGKVTAVDGSGAVTAYTLTATGGGFNTVTGRSTTTLTGSGSGLTINITSIGTGNDDTAAFVAAAADAASQGAAVIVPHGCWVQNLTLPEGSTLIGSGWGPTYGYDKTQLPLLYVIGAPTYGIKISNRGITLVGFEVNANYNNAAYGSTTCIGTNVGNSGGGGFGEKTVLHSMSMKGCNVGYGNLGGGGGYIFTDIFDSDFGANQYGIWGPLSDPVIDHSVFVSGDYGIVLSSSAGGYARITYNRLEYLNVDAIQLNNGGAFQNTLIGNQIDRTGEACLRINNGEMIDVTGGQMKGCGAHGSFRVTGAADNGSGLIRLTIVSNYPGPHSSSCTTTCYTSGMSTGNVVDITGVGGTTNANGSYTITVVNGNQIDLQGSTFNAAYTSGGYGGVRGKSSNIYITGTSRNITFSNVVFSGTTGGAVYTPSYIVQAPAGTYSNIRFHGIANASTSYSDSGYAMSFDSWIGGSKPTNYTVDMLGYGRFDNRTQLSINATGDVAIGATSAMANSALDLSAKTSSLVVPKGTSAQQPTAVAGMMRYNTTNNAFEFAQGSSPTWQTFNPSSVTWPTSGQVVVSNGTNSPAGWSFPTSGNIVVSAGTSQPTGLAPVDGLCVVGVSGTWGVGSCAGTTSTNLGTSATATSPQRTGDPTTGFYTPAAGTIGIAASGTKITEFTATGLDIGGAKITYNSGTNLVSFPTTDTTVGASVAIGSGALANLPASAAYANTAIGYLTMNGTMTTAAVFNTAIGYRAGNAITSGNNNTLIGKDAGKNVTSGVSNTFIGQQAGNNITGGNRNVGIGYAAGQSSSSGSHTSSDNVSIGYNSANNVDTASNIISIGSGSYQTSNYGSTNIAIGNNTMQNVYANGTPTNNTVVGHYAASNAGLLGNSNTVLGNYAGYNLGNTSNNVLTGFESGYYMSTAAGSVGIGYRSLKGASGAATTGANNTAIGINAGLLVQGAAANNLILGPNVGSTTLTTGSSNILIGTSNAVTTPAAGTSNYLSIGNLNKGDLSKMHRYFGGSAPAVSACGTSPTIDANATDSSGMVTAGATATSCTITFNQAYTSFNHCSVTTQAAKADLAYSYTTSAITVTSATLGGVNIDYRCDGN